MNTKAISPVIATVLLISLVIILAAIVFIWARNALPEALIKNDSPIENACAELSISADYSSGVVTVNNQGNILIYGFIVSKKGGFGAVETIGSFADGNNAARIGETIDLPKITANVPATGDEIVLTPVLLGETLNNERKTFECIDNTQSLIVP